jgi:hypothetical protein
MKAVQKQKKTVYAIFITICLFVLFLGGLSAETISQQIGFRDVAFSSLIKTDCQKCHGESLVNDHHNTSQAVSGNCVACHSVSKEPGKLGVSLQRDCMICHQTTPHHKSEAAVNKECNSCHESSGLSDYSMDVPAYKISKVTPTVSNCKKCHFEGEEEGIKIASIKETHHGISLSDCNACHEPGEGDKKTTNIRICERCHNVKAIHEVMPHLEQKNCIVCHGKTDANG